MTPNFKNLWDTCQLDNCVIEDNKKVFSTIYANILKYKLVESITGAPWKLIAAIHYRESSLSFKGCLHNGDPWNKVTTHVPKGRGPFESWQAAAVDALMMDKGNFPAIWNIEGQLEFAEKFNGLGYRRTNELSPYIWAYTNHHDETGKYVADGRYSATAHEDQLGIAAIMLGIDAYIKSTVT